jgi:hypothetical protein
MDTKNVRIARWRLLLFLVLFFPLWSAADECAQYRTIPKPGFNEYPITRDVFVGKLLAGIMFPVTDSTHSTREREVALLQAIMRTLEPHLPPHARKWKYDFHILENAHAVDAKALPGGPIYVTTGTFLESLHVDLIAVVLAHEVGHVALRHGTRFETVQSQNLVALNNALEKRKRATTPEEKALLENRVTDALATFWDEDSIVIQHELEADMFAAHVASSAGYNLEVSARFHERLAGHSEDLENATTHPPRLVRARILRCFGENSRTYHEELDVLLHEIQADYARHTKRARGPKSLQ